MTAYLDTAAAAPVRADVLEAMRPFLAPGTGTIFANPSSRHEPGELAARALDAARAEVAGALGCRPGEVVFTSGGTESANLAIKGIALADPRGRHLVCSPLEHDAVLESARFLVRHLDFELTVLPVDGAGLVDPEAIRRAIRPDTTLVSVQHASGEIGTVQPVADLAAVAREVGVPFHSDAVQSAGVLDVRRDVLGVDALGVAGHKLGTPRGIGALLVRSGLPVEPVLHGGGQERGRRSGTENVAGAVALAVALRSADSASAARIAAVRDRLIDGVLGAVPHAMLTGARRSRLPGHASFCFPGTAGEAVLLELGRRGIAVSSGSACAAGSDEPSPALLAIGVDPAVAQTAVRFSFGDELDDAGATTLAAAVAESVAAVAALRR